MNGIRGEILRLRATGTLTQTVIIALVCGAGVTLLLALTGPQYAQPPMPDIDTPEGVGFVLGIGTILLFIPAAIGTVAVTGEYRHRTIGTTFLAVPRRGRVLAAKLLVFAVLGLAYGSVFAVSSACALVAAAGIRGVPLGVSIAELTLPLAQLTLAAACYTLLGVGVGALTRSALLAVGIVLGYSLFAEYLLMLLPGVNTLYPLLPGGATASLTGFDFLTDVIASQTALAPAATASPVLGALTLTTYAAVASLVAVAVPLRRDLT